MKSKNPGRDAVPRSRADETSGNLWHSVEDLVVAALASARRLVGDRRGRGYLTCAVLMLSVTGVSSYSLAGGDPHPVGGVDLQTFCGSFDFEAQDETDGVVTCHSPIDLDGACVREHHLSEFFRLADPKNPKSGSCYDRADKNFGGIKDMAGYCRDTYRISENPMDSPVVAEPVDQIWQCRMPVDVSAVCGGQHNDSDLTADRDGTTWKCYRTE